MTNTLRTQPSESLFPRPWRMAVVALCTLILCSCRAPSGQQCAEDPFRGHTAGYGDLLPPGAYTGVPGAVGMIDGSAVGYANPSPMPYEPQGPWAPSGISRPWPPDEYIRDGGDIGVQADVSGQGIVGGIEMEDTVAVGNTPDGRTIVEPSNKVYLYAPRFGAVRQVVGLVAHEEHQHVGGVYLPEHIISPTTLQLVADAEQNVQAIGETAVRPAVALRTKQGDGIMSSVIHPRGFQDAFKAYENLSIIRMGVYEEAEMPFLATVATAAVAWDHVQAVQIILDRTGAMAEVKYDSASSVYTVSSPPGKPRLRVVKVASTSFAKPGEDVYFTIRFDNIGEESLENVTIIDSLNTRLEYAADSAQCSVEAQFSSKPNEGGSVAVSCMLSQPLEPGEGGILRFRCRVR